MSALVRTLLCAMAADRRPGIRLYMLVAEQSSPEADIQRGDLVVYAQAAPRPGEAVVWSSQAGQPLFGRIGQSGQIRIGGKWRRPARIRGVIVAAITQSHKPPGSGRAGRF